MKLPDVNIWLALALSGHSHHEAARVWLDGEEAADSIFFCRTTQQGLVRLMTTSEVMACYGIAPLSNRAAWRVIDCFMEDDRIAFAGEPAGVEEAWKNSAIRDTHSPKLWMDAWLAAFALCAGYEMVTTDKALKQFKGLQVRLIEVAKQ
jgi:uncharacterized protein